MSNKKKIKRSRPPREKVIDWAAFTFTLGVVIQRERKAGTQITDIDSIMRKFSEEVKKELFQKHFPTPKLTPKEILESEK